MQSSGINSDGRESKEADQHAFIDDLKKKKLLRAETNPELKYNLLEAMDEEHFDDFSSGDGDTDQNGDLEAGSNESQDGGALSPS